MKSVRIYYCSNLFEGNLVPAELADMGMRDDVIIESVPCGGRIDPRYLLKAFECGASGVCVLTCPLGECRLMEGNIRAMHRVELAREYLAEAGVEPDAVEIIVPSERSQEAIKTAIDKIASFVGQESCAAQEVMA
ncbi:hydrogenase iron-sulfur subunit [bacterium]|nr:hydrogenase iron-sulfur subunit [bacterium]